MAHERGRTGASGPRSTSCLPSPDPLLDRGLDAAEPAPKMGAYGPAASTALGFNRTS